MGKYTSYYLYQKYEKIGSQDWTPVYPSTLSVYSDGTESGSTVIKSDNDTACGYKPSTEVQYRWVKLNPSTDYICDNCELWVASGYICDNGDLYEQLNEQNFDGKNWYYTGTKKKGKLIEENSKKCTGDTGGTGGDTGTTTGDTPSMRVKYYTDSFDRIIKTYYNLTSIEKDFDKDSYPKKEDAESVEIFNSVKSIGDNAFSGCKKLFNITIPNSVTSIGGQAFGWCEMLCRNLTGLTIPNSVTSIGGRAFYDCQWIKSISIPDGVTRIYQETFAGCVSLTSITIPNSVTEIDSGAFAHCTSLRTLTIPDNVKSIEWQTFTGCKALTSIIIGNGVTEIGEEAFKGCTNLKNIKIGNNVKTIGVNAFSGCTSFTDIILPASVIQINAKAFYTCSSLKNITVKATTPPTLQSFNTLPGNIGLTIYVPASSLNAYKSNGSWKDYNIQAIP